LQQEEFRRLNAKREGTNLPPLMLGMGYVGHRLFCNFTIQN